MPLNTLRRGTEAELEPNGYDGVPARAIPRLDLPYTARRSPISVPHLAARATCSWQWTWAAPACLANTPLFFLQMAVVNRDSPGTEAATFLDSVEGEIALFRSVMRARPVGIHRHFHILTIQNAILRDTGRLISPDDLWCKLRTCYNLDILETIEADGYDPFGVTSSPTPPNVGAGSPSPAENLNNHPWFRQEFSFPPDESYEPIVSVRRMQTTASLPSSSPSTSPSPIGRLAGGRKGKSKLKNMAGLVSGDSDSSALTQDSGDESVSPTPRESIATGTDGGTEYAEEEDGEGREQSPGIPLATKLARKTTKAGRRGSGSSRARGASIAGGRGTKRKKK